MCASANREKEQKTLMITVVYEYAWFLSISIKTESSKRLTIIFICNWWKFIYEKFDNLSKNYVLTDQCINITDM